jgi:hypothetical protein
VVASVQIVAVAGLLMTVTLAVNQTVTCERVYTAAEAAAGGKAAACFCKSFPSFGNFSQSICLGQSTQLYSWGRLLILAGIALAFHYLSLWTTKFFAWWLRFQLKSTTLLFTTLSSAVVSLSGCILPVLVAG